MIEASASVVIEASVEVAAHPGKVLTRKAASESPSRARAEREYVGALESSHQMGGNDVSGRLMEITSYGQPLSDRHLPRISAWKANLPAFLCFLKKYSHGLLPREIGASISGAQDGDVLRCEAKAARKLLIINLSEPRTYALLRRIVLSLGESTHQARSGFQASGRTYGHPLPRELDRH